MATTTSVRDQIVTLLDDLGEEQLKRVLAFAASLSRPRGEPGKLMLERTAHIHIPTEDLEEIKQAIEEDCERIEWDGWDLPA